MWWKWPCTRKARHRRCPAKDALDRGRLAVAYSVGEDDRIGRLGDLDRNAAARSSSTAPSIVQPKAVASAQATRGRRSAGAVWPRRDAAEIFDRFAGGATDMERCALR